MMKRALQEILPLEILERKRKAYVSHGPITHLRNAQQRIENLFSNSLIVDYGLIDRDKFIQSLRTELTGDLKWIGHLRKTIEMELWFQSVRTQHANLRLAASNHLNRNEILPVSYRANKLRESNAGY